MANKPANDAAFRAVKDIEVRDGVTFWSSCGLYGAGSGAAIGSDPSWRCSEAVDRPSLQDLEPLVLDLARVEVLRAPTMYRDARAFHKE